MHHLKNFMYNYNVSLVYNYISIMACNFIFSNFAHQHNEDSSRDRFRLNRTNLVDLVNVK